MIYYLAAVSAIAGLLFGYDEGVIAVAHRSLDHTFPMSTFASGFNTAAVPLGALVGAVLAGRLTENLGRRRVLMIAAALFTLGALASATAASVPMLMASRIVLGLAIGVAAVVAPLYIAETAPLSIRGALVSTYQLAITIGIVVSYLTGLLVSGDDAWRIMFALGAIPGLVFLIGLFFLPESPRWLVLRHREPEAAASLRRLRGNDADVQAEIASIRGVAAAESRAHGKLGDVLAPWVRPALIVGAGLFFLQQLSGINAVIYYAPTIFGAAGLDGHSTQVMATIGVGLVNFLVTILAMALIDRWGRRPLLVLGFAGTAGSLLLIAVATAFPQVFSPWMIVAALFVYIASFAVSLGPLPHVMMSEVFPLAMRGAGMGMASVSNWGFNFVVVLLFPILLGSIGLGATFTVFAVICLAGIVFTLVRVPETNGISLEQIEAHLQAGRPLNELRPAPDAKVSPSVIQRGVSH